MDFYTELNLAIKQKKLNKDDINKLKIKLCSKYKLKKIPTDIEILLSAKSCDTPFLKKYLATKPTRSLSGVSVVAIMTKPHKCPHGKCSICPGGLKSDFGNVPQSYTGTEPATRRAIRNNYSAYLQVFNRLEQYIAAGHSPQKIELIIMGGTFISIKGDYPEIFVTEAFMAMNDFSRLFYKNKVFDIKKYKEFFELPGDIKNKKREKRIQIKILKQKKQTFAKNLASEQKKNENSNIRCVGLTIETRSDYGRLKHGNKMLKLGCTRVEVGVQSVYDEALQKIERGHTTKDNVKSIKELKDLGFKINIHYMPGLVTYKKDLDGMKQLFTNPDYRPDMLKIYPCMVIKGTKLYKKWKSGKYAPLTTEQATKLIAEFKPFVPKYVRIMRVQRDIPSKEITSGVKRTNLRQYVHEYMKTNDLKCECIRCREVSRRPISGKTQIYVQEYDASGGVEFFISAEIGKQESIVGFCRLRFPSQILRDEITDKTGLIRELHVYGKTTDIGKKGSVQHKGIGKKLLLKAEQICKKNSKDKVVVISGVGVRGYYRKLGYRKQGVYMVKRI